MAHELPVSPQRGPTPGCLHWLPRQGAGMLRGNYPAIQPEGSSQLPTLPYNLSSITTYTTQQGASQH